MFCQAGFDQWLTTIKTPLPHVSKPQATVLALWSCGMVLARSCALSAVSSLLAAGMHRKEQTVRQQLREWYYDVPRKRGAKRPALRVETCLTPLLGWVVRWWQGTPLALAIDATTLGQRFVGLAIRVVYRGCAIPVAWVILPAGATHAWRRAWLRLLRQLRPAMPQGWTVLVLADRGWYAPWLFRRITRLGWPPFLRSNTGGSFRATGATCWRPLTRFVPQPGTRGRGTGLAFTRNQVACTLLARWEEGDTDPWLLLTDLGPEASDAGWYGLRAWIEQGLKITKRAGWQWHRTRMSAPDRAARRWLAVGRVSVGGEGERHVEEGVPEAGQAGDPPAAGERVSPRLGAAADSTAAPGAVARGTLGARTLASGAAAGGSNQRASRGPACRSLRRQGRAAEAARAKVYAFSTPYEKVSPSKGGGGDEFKRHFTFTGAKGRETLPQRVRRLLVHAGVGLVERQYLLATTGWGNGRGNGRQLAMTEDTCDHRCMGDGGNDAQGATSAQRQVARPGATASAQRVGALPSAHTVAEDRSPCTFFPAIRGHFWG